MKIPLIFLFFIALSSFVYCQKIPGDTTVSSLSVNAYQDYRHLLLEDEMSVEHPVYKPILGLGKGVFTYFGDVNDAYRGSNGVGIIGTNFKVSRNMNPFLKVNFNVVYGKLTGNEHTAERNLNFQSTIINYGVNVSYNFLHLVGTRSPIMPFISLGVETFEFDSKGDLLDAKGNPYHYWSDGSIRNIEESSDNIQNSIILQRDYDYETSLRELDSEGLGSYAQVAFGIPIDIGVDLHVTDRLKIRVGNTLRFSFSDLVDNVSSVGKGAYQGDKKRDRFLYSYVSFDFDLFSPPRKTKLDMHYADVDFMSIYLDDYDLDKVDDWDDKCQGTPPGVQIDHRGCPLDDDGDGVPNYLDKEPNTPKGTIVNARGVTMTEKELMAIHSDYGVERSRMYDYYPELRDGKEEFEGLYLGIPEKFRPLDLDKDAYISIDELLKAIDKFFDFETNYGIDDIYELNDFFFDQ